MTLSRRNQVRRCPLAIAVAICTALIVVDGGTSVAPTALAAQASRAASADGLEVLEVRPNFFMIAGAGGNVGVQVGEDGVVVVDAGSAASAAALVAAIKRITPQPIRYVIDTGPDADHVGGNDVLSKAGNQFFPGTRAAGARPDVLRSVASILAAEGVLRHMTVRRTATLPSGCPPRSFHYAKKFLYLNGEAIEVLHQPAAHTDSDVFAFFRRSDVVVAGDVIDTRRFPVIDIERGGSIDGEIAALNRLSELAVASVPIVSREAGTIVIPGHGRLYDQFDVIEYRDMVTIIRDRVRDLVKAGRSLEQVKAAQPGKGLRGALRQRWRRLDDGHVHRSCVPEPREGEAVRRSLVATAVDSSSLVFAVGGASAQRRKAGRRSSPSRRATSAPIDLTGYWVSYVTENWRYRMVTPAKGEYRRIPASPAALPIINAWDPAADQRAGNQCKSYGAGAIMSVPGRLHITWQDADTLRIDTDAGTQTRLFRFTVARPATRLLGAARPAGRASRAHAGSASLDLTAVAACASSRRTCAPATCERTVCPTASAQR